MAREKKSYDLDFSSAEKFTMDSVERAAAATGLCKFWNFSDASSPMAAVFTYSAESSP